MAAWIEFVTATGEAEEHHDQTHHWLWPEGYELLFGGIAAVIIFALLAWKAGPIVKKSLAARTERIQAEIDAATQAEAEAAADAERIRAAMGDIEAERARLLADADERAAALLTDGRARLAREVDDLEAKAHADVAALATRSADELRFDIARFASIAADRVVADALDDETQQRLVEEFIAGVGATTPEGAHQ